MSGDETLVEASFICSRLSMERLTRALSTMEDNTRIIHPKEADKILDILRQIEDSTKELKHQPTGGLIMKRG